ncbi:MAG: hypothetical protein R3F20_08670 [Planctomycetota bacterium]
MGSSGRPSIGSSRTAPRIGGGNGSSSGRAAPGYSSSRSRSAGRDGTAGTRYYPYGTNSGPRLAPSSGGRSGTRGGVSGRSDSRGTGGLRLADGERSRSAGRPGSSGTGRTRGGSVELGGARTRDGGREGFRGFGAKGRTGDRSAADYRAQLDARTGGRTVTPGRGVGGAAVLPNRGVSDRPAAGGRSGGGRGGDGRTGGDRGGLDSRRANRPAPGYSHYDSGYDYGHHHGGYHHDDHHGYYWDCGYRFGFGFGLGWFGYRGWSYHSWCWPYFRYGYYYPWGGWCHYPYYWSYSCFPLYRSYRSPWYSETSVYYVDAPGYASDPYVDDVVYLDPGVVDVAPTRSVVVSSSPVVLAPAEVLAGQQFAEGIDAGRDPAAAVALGRRLMSEGKPLEAAEALRQAFLLRNDPGTLRLMGLALYAASDWQMASWALQKGVGDSEKAVLDLAVELDDFVGGAAVAGQLMALERYLVAEPNDEASNFLLGALYTLTGRDYAAYVLLNRLSAAGYQRETTDLFLRQARLALTR